MRKVIAIVLIFMMVLSFSLMSFADPVEDPDTPTEGEPTGDETPGDEPVGDETPADETPGDEPTGDEPTGDEPTGDEPTGDEPTGDEPTGDEPTGDEPTGDEPTVDETPVLEGDPGDGIPNGDGGDGQPVEVTFVIEHGTVDEVIEYIWDLQATVDETAFAAVATRMVDIHQLQADFSLSIDETIEFDQVVIQMGNTDEVEGFVPVYEFSTLPLNMQMADGMKTFDLDLDIDLLVYPEPCSTMRIRVPAGIASSGVMRYADLTTGIDAATRDNYDLRLINEDAWLYTNLMEAFEPYAGAIELLEDDWYITPSLLVGEKFSVTVPIELEGVEEVGNIVIHCTLENNDARIFDELKVTFAGSEVIVPPEFNWKGLMYQGLGHWLPPVTGDFILERKAMQIKFWVDSSLTHQVGINIYEAETDESGETIFGQLVKVIPTDQVTTKNCGKHSRIDEGTVSGDYYRYKLKAKELTELYEGRRYILALMVEDQLLMFSEDSPATVEFMIADGAMTKGGMQDALGNNPKRLTSKRSRLED